MAEELGIGIRTILSKVSPAGGLLMIPNLPNFALQSS